MSEKPKWTGYADFYDVWRQDTPGWKWQPVGDGGMTKDQAAVLTEEIRRDAAARGEPDSVTVRVTRHMHPGQRGLSPEQKARIRRAAERQLAENPPPPLSEEQRDRIRLIFQGGRKSQSLTCPRCGTTSTDPGDIAYGYCAKCGDWTSPGEPLDPKLG